jgi:hypothetical protein
MIRKYFELSDIAGLFCMPLLANGCTEISWSE